MTKFVKSFACTCGCEVFECLPGKRLVCPKCGIIRIHATYYKVIFEQTLPLDKDVIKKNIENIEGFLLNLEKEINCKLEEEERQRELKRQELKIKEELIRQENIVAKQNAIKQLTKLFNENFLNSKQEWLANFSNWINEGEYLSLAVAYVRNWFKQQGYKIPDFQQAKCIVEGWNDVQVIARAGSGKTATIVNKAAFLVKHCRVNPSEILLLAFNREAAEEVNERLKNMLGNNSPQAMTFHALAYALIHPEESLIYDDELTGYHKSQTVQQVIDSFIKSNMWSDQIKEFMLKYFRSNWDEIISKGYHLTPEEMVSFRRSIPYIGLDGKHYKSGGEKRIADYLFEHDVSYKYERNIDWDGLNYKPDFTVYPNNDSSKKIKAIIIEYYGMVGEKSYNLQILEKQRFWKKKPQYFYIELYPWQVENSELLNFHIGKYLMDFNLLKEKLSDIEIWHRIKDRAVDEFSLLVSQFIGRCRKLMINPDDLRTIVLKSRSSFSDIQKDFIGIVWNIYKKYLRTLQYNDEEDFDGLLIRAIKHIQSDNTDWKRKSGSGELKKLKYLFIDEYQDFSLLFFELVSAIRKSNHLLKIFCVGDNWQAINGFAGSDLKYFENFSQYFPESVILNISTNYRSPYNIVELGNQLMVGEGEQSQAENGDLGEVYLVKINEYSPNEFEKVTYKGDIITPALIRLVYTYTLKGNKVALLCRRGNGLPWYTSYNFKKGRYHNDFLKAIRIALPEEQRALVVAMDTAHSYKGKEEDVIIVVDAISRSYPLIHPSNVFFQVLGTTIDKIVAEEKRLFYVALSRAKKSLIVITEKGNESPFLVSIPNKNEVFKRLSINDLKGPKQKGTRYIVKISNNGLWNDTYDIRIHLTANKYQWSPGDKAWLKQYSANNFSKNKLLNESWVKQANNVRVTVLDEFSQVLYTTNIQKGREL